MLLISLVLFYNLLTKYLGIVSLSINLLKQLVKAERAHHKVATEKILSDPYLPVKVGVAGFVPVIMHCSYVATRYWLTKADTVKYR